MVNYKSSQNLQAENFHCASNNQKSFNSNPKVKRLYSMRNYVLLILKKVKMMQKYVFLPQYRAKTTRNALTFKAIQSSCYD